MMQQIIHTLDHLAIQVDDRDRVARDLCSELGWHVIERNERLTLVGCDARAGKLTLFNSPAASTGEARPASITAAPLIDRIWLRAAPAKPDADGEVPNDARRIDGLPPLVYTGAVGAGPRGEVVSFDLVFDEVPAGTTTVVLDHLGLLVDDVEAERVKLAAHDVATDRIDGPNTRAIFVTAAGGVRIELIEHLPEFALV